MSKELPHASIRCPECSTRLKVTLKKGRLPSRPIPCPKCDTPIPVTEDDVVQPGKKKKRKRSMVELRETKVADLRQTRVGNVEPSRLVDQMNDPPTRDVPTAEQEAAAGEDPPTRDVPTAEHDLDDPPTRDVPTAENEAAAVASDETEDDSPSNEADESADELPTPEASESDVEVEASDGESDEEGEGAVEEAEADEADETDREDDEGVAAEAAAEESPAAEGFGVMRKRRRASGPRRDAADDLALAVNSPGVHVVKGEGEGARDEVFGPKQQKEDGAGVAIGRIRPIKKRASEVAKVDVDDPDLPARKPVADDEPGADEEAAGEEQESSKKKINLPKLRKALAKLKKPGESEAASEEEGEVEEVGALDLELEFDDDEVSEAFDRASEAVDEEASSPELDEEAAPGIEEDSIADVSAGDIEIGDIPMADLSVEDLPIDDYGSEADEVDDEEEPALGEFSEPMLVWDDSEPEVARDFSDPIDESEPEIDQESEPENDQESEPELDEESEPEVDEEVSEELAASDDSVDELEPSDEMSINVPRGSSPVGVIVTIVVLLAVIAAAYFLIL